MKSTRRAGKKRARHGETPYMRSSGETSGTSSSPTILRSKLCGFTAGGSGTASTEAATIKTLSTNAIYTSDFKAIPTGPIIADSLLGRRAHFVTARRGAGTHDRAIERYISAGDY